MIIRLLDRAATENVCLFGNIHSRPLTRSCISDAAILSIPDFRLTLSKTATKFNFRNAMLADGLTAGRIAETFDNSGNNQYKRVFGRAR